MTVVVTYEDRREALAGVELLAWSLMRHSPDLKFRVYSPLEEVRSRLARLPRACWVPTTDLTGQGWNVKPTVLLRALEEAPRAFWLDTDVIVSGALQPLIDCVPVGAIAVGTEYLDPKGIGGRIRAEAHGWAAARSLPHSVNSGTLLVDRSHSDLLQVWRETLMGAAYRKAQSCPVETRAVAYGGDQDVLWAALASAHFDTVPVHYFNLGRDLLLQEGANRFHVSHRFAVLRGAQPPLVHMLGQYKPWGFAGKPTNSMSFLEYSHLVFFETSPYFQEASIYTEHIFDPDWLVRRTLPGRLLSAALPRSPALQGLPFALVAWAMSGFR